MEYIYSDSLGEMVIKGFTYKGERYEWNDFDCVYYNVDTDEDYFFDVPSNAEF